MPILVAIEGEEFPCACDDSGSVWEDDGSQDQGHCSCCYQNGHDFNEKEITDRWRASWTCCCFSLLKT